MKKQQLQKLLAKQELKNQDIIRSELENLLSYNNYLQDSDNIYLDINISLSTLNIY